MSKNFELLNSSGKQESLMQARHPLGPCTIADQPRKPEEQEWLRALLALRRHWRWSLGFAIIVSVGVVLTVLLMKPVYEPTARIEVDPPGNELFSLEPGARSDSIAYAETQAKALKTDQLALAVIRKLHLDQNRELVAPSSIKGESGPAPMDPISGQSEVTAAERQALKVFRRSLQVQRDTSSWLINVSFAANDPQLAALVTNTVVDQFLDTNYRTQHDAIVQSTQWLSHQLDDIRTRVEESNQALADFQKSSGITPTGDAHSTFDEKVSDINKQLTAAQADRIQLESLLKNVRAGKADVLPQVKADPVVQELLKEIASARAVLKQVLIIYGKNHPRTRESQTLIAELENQLKAQQDSILVNLRTGYAAAHTRENLLNSELKEANKQLGRMAQYEALRKDAQAKEELYNTLYTKIKETGIAAESKSSNLRVVDRASILGTPTRPRRLLDIALGMLAGIVGGFMVAVVREGLDRRIHTPDDVRNLTGVSSVALMPVIGNAKKLKNGNGSREIFLMQRFGSAESEALLGLFASVRLSRPNRPVQVLLIASAMACEGKTTIAANLSVALARQGIRTCLIEADLRKSGMASLFGIKSELGLSSALHGCCSVEEALMPVPGVPNLSLVPGGAVPENSGELICSEHMCAVLMRLRQLFQVVVVDSSPILPYADARALSMLTDGVILVGRVGVTTRQAMKRSLELLERMHSAPVLEVVLNGVDFNSSEYQYDYGYAYNK